MLCKRKKLEKDSERLLPLDKAISVPFHLSATPFVVFVSVFMQTNVRHVLVWCHVTQG